MLYWRLNVWENLSVGEKTQMQQACVHENKRENICVCFIFAEGEIHVNLIYFLVKA